MDPSNNTASNNKQEALIEVLEFIKRKTEKKSRMRTISDGG
jgi:hypothetical protein